MLSFLDLGKNTFFFDVLLEPSQSYLKRFIVP